MAEPTSAQQSDITDAFGSAVLIDLSNPKDKSATVIVWAMVGEAMETLIQMFSDRGIAKTKDDKVVQRNWPLTLWSLARDTEAQASLAGLLGGYNRAAVGTVSTDGIAEGDTDDPRKLSSDDLDKLFDVGNRATHQGLRGDL